MRLSHSSCRLPSYMKYVCLPVSDHPDKQVLKEVGFTRNKSVKTSGVIMTPSCQFYVATGVREDTVLDDLIGDVSGVDCPPGTLALNNDFDL